MSTQPTFLGSLRRRWPILALLAGATLLGCPYSPVGTNAAPDPYPTPNANKVVLTFSKDLAGEATKATFTVKGDAGLAAVTDDSPDDDFTAEFDTSKLKPEIYTVDVTLDTAEDGDNPVAQLIFIVPGTPSEDDATAPDAAATS